MSVKPLLPSPSSNTRRTQPEGAAPKKHSNPLEALAKGLERVAHKVEAVAHKVETAVEKAVDRFEAKLPSLPRLDAVKPWEGITLTGKPLQIPLKSLLSVDLNTVRKILEHVVPQKIRDDEAKQLVGQTADFRETLGKVKALALELDMLPPSSPRRAEVAKALEAAEGKLKSEYGYTRQTAPRPGAMWVDPQFLAKELPGGKLSASRFPTGTPVTKPPAPADFIFGGGPKEIQLSGGRTVHNAEEYKAAVAARRAELGMPVKDGELTGVHLSLEGGGGKGKRYAAMMSEMYDLGVVPTSLSGSSAGAIAAAFIATGATPEQVGELAKDPRLGQFYDWDLDMKDGGIFNGQVAFDTFDQELRRLTGITDRPVTFADLKVPLQILAAKEYDSAAGPDGLKTAKDRIFVFSQETTPDTPVALAVRASMAIPGAFEPVQMVDPTTGRSMHLVDGGALDNLPMGYNKNNLPSIGVSLYSRMTNHPGENANDAHRMPNGNLDTTNVLWSALNGYALMKNSASGYQDFLDRTQPKSNQFMLSVPTWDLTNPKQENSTLGFAYDDKLDPKLDGQTHEVTRDFLRNFLDDLRVPGSRGTNVTTEVPKNLHFEVPVELDGRKYQVSYAGGDSVAVRRDDGRTFNLKLGQTRIEAMYLDNMAFGDLQAQMTYALKDPRSVKPSSLPF